MSTIVGRVGLLSGLSWRNVLTVAISSLVIAVSAQIQLPVYPVPVTLQTLAVLGIAMLFGPKLGVSAIALYLFEGCLGMPVFSGFKSGIGTLMGPTGGYLLGFLGSAYVAGCLANNGQTKSLVKVFIVGSIAVVPVFAVGVCWLANYIGWQSAYALGVQPFLLGELLKLIFLSVVISSACKLRKASSHMP